MYYEVHGKGEPLLLIAGRGANLTAWQFQIPEFSKKYRVVAFDNRGSGRTDAPDKPYSIGMMADDAIGLMDTLGIGEAHILGHSMGGYIAQTIAIEFPKRTRSLILAGSAAASRNVPAVTKHINQTVVAAMRDGATPKTIAMMQLPTLVTSRLFETPEIVAVWVDALAANPWRPQAYALQHQGDACAGFDSLGQLKRIAAPTLVLVGKEDNIMPVKLSEELAKLIPEAKLVVLDGGAHFFFAEIADKFNQSVLEFLAQIA